MKIHHVAYAVEKIEAAAEKLELFGYETQRDTVMDELRGIRIQFMRHRESGLLLELVEPAAEKNPVSGCLEKSGGSSTPYHICYETQDLEAAVDMLRKKGFLMTQKPAPAPAIDGRRVAFLFSRDTGIIELVEQAQR